MANLIPVIAKELGVELNEPFKIVGNGDRLWRFTETNFQFYDKHFQDDWVNVNSQSVAKLVLETPEIIKLPFMKTMNCIGVILVELVGVQLVHIGQMILLIFVARLVVAYSAPKKKLLEQDLPNIKN